VTAEEPRWFGLAGLYAATALQGRALREHVAATLAPHVDGWHAEERVGDPVAGRELLWETEPAFGWLQGVPHEESLRSAYWAKPSTPERDLDPDRDRCGVVWVCAALPLRGRDVARLATVVESVMPAHGFDPMLAVVAPTERCAYAVPSILYDRDEAGADARAKRCHDALLDAFAREQWLPHRLGVGAMERMAGWTDDSAAVLRRVRAALDPAAVVAPGRYDAYVTSGDAGGVIVRRSASRSPRSRSFGTRASAARAASNARTTRSSRRKVAPHQASSVDVRSALVSVGESSPRSSAQASSAAEAQRSTHAAVRL
jgi:hypothetical protein